MRALFVVAVLGACGGGDGAGNEIPADLDVIASTPASGSIMEVPFTLGTRFMSQSGGDLNIDLLPTAAPDCTLDRTDGKFPFVIFLVPARPGRYPLGGAQTVTFVDRANSNLIVQDGVIQIDTVTTAAITGGLHVFDADFGEINGRFDGTLCFSN